MELKDVREGNYVTESTFSSRGLVSTSTTSSLCLFASSIRAEIVFPEGG